MKMRAMLALILFGWTAAALSQTIQFPATSASGDESVTSVQIPVTFTGGLFASASVDYAVIGGTATNNVRGDYVLANGTLNFSIFFPTADITIPINDDALDEPDETIIIQLGNPSGATLGRDSVFTYTILDNDPPPEVAFKVAADSGAESTAQPQLVVSLSARSGKTVGVSYAVSGGTANAGTDYTLAAGQLVFNPGVTSLAVPLTVVDDPLDEPDETVEVTLSNPVNATLGATAAETYTILDNDPPPTVSFVFSAFGVGESGGGAGFPIVLSQPSAKPVSVHYGVTGGTATGGGVDYTLDDGTMDFAPGEKEKTLSVIFHDDTLHETDETIEIALSGPVNATLGSPTTFTMTIIDDDPPPHVNLTRSHLAVNETAGTATLVVRLAGNDTVFTPLTVDYRTTGTGGLNQATAGQDYTATSGTLTFDAPGDERTIQIPIIDDNILEGPERFLVQLGNPLNVTVGTSSSCLVTIFDQGAEEPTPPTQAIVDYVLGRTNDATGLDVNFDGAVDVADILHNIDFAQPEPPHGPSPADGAAATTIGTTLDWADSARATGYDVYFWKSGDAKPGAPTATGLAASVFDPPLDLQYSTAYQWQVIARNGIGQEAGPVWTFTTQVAPPDAPAAPNPADGATAVVVQTALDWSDAARADSYDLYLWKSGDAPPGSPTAPALAASFYQPPTSLEFGTTYQWQVMARDAAGATAGPVWSFTTQIAPPDAPATPAPADGAVDVAPATNLTWAASARAASYDLYFWPDGQSQPTTPTATGLAAPLYDPPADLAFGATYHWQVVATNATASTAGPVWTFTTVPPLPDAPAGPNPADGATDVAFNTLLDWADAARATSYDVYLWKAADAKPATPTTSGLTLSQYQPAALEFSSAYRWQVVAHNPQGATPGPEWGFTVYAQPIQIVGISPTTDVWVHGDQKFVHWKTTPAIAGTSVRVELWLAGAKVADVGTDSNASGDSTFNFTVPTVPSFNLFYKLRVISVSDPSLFVENDGFVSVL